MIAASYFHQAEPRRRRVLKQTLETFSIGHAHLLHAHDSPFAPDDWRPQDQSLGEFIRAVLICSQSYTRAKAALRSPWLNWKQMAWGKLCGRFDFLVERELLRQHILEATAVPEIWSNGGRPLGSPTLLLLWQHLRWFRELNEADVMDYAFGKALWDYIGNHESRGGLQVLNDTERAAKAMLEEIQRETEAAKNPPAPPPPEEKPNAV